MAAAGAYDRRAQADTAGGSGSLALGLASLVTELLDGVGAGLGGGKAGN